MYILEILLIECKSKKKEKSKKKQKEKETTSGKENLFCSFNCTIINNTNK